MGWVHKSIAGLGVLFSISIKKTISLYFIMFYVQAHCLPVVGIILVGGTTLVHITIPPIGSFRLNITIPQEPSAVILPYPYRNLQP